MDYEALRHGMVNEQLIPRGISDQRVIAALLKVPRHVFVSDQYRCDAYDDHPLPIGDGQTISQPYMVALMTERLALNGSEAVLEIGTGSGYQTAVLCECARAVYTVERIPALADAARAIITGLGYRNCYFFTGDGSKGWPEHAPYDAIIVTAAAPSVPYSLISQLKIGGRIILPVGGPFGQVLTCIIRTGGSFIKEDICGCTFVPLIGDEGWRR